MWDLEKGRKGNEDNKMAALNATINKLVNKFDKFEVKNSNNNSQNSNTGNNNRTTSTNGRNNNNASWTPDNRFNGNNHSAETQRPNNTKKWYLIPPTNGAPNQIKKYDKTWYWCKECNRWRLYSTQEHIKNSNSPTNHPSNQTPATVTQLKS